MTGAKKGLGWGSGRRSAPVTAGVRTVEGERRTRTADLAALDLDSAPVSRYPGTPAGAWRGRARCLLRLVRPAHGHRRWTTHGRGRSTAGSDRG